VLGWYHLLIDTDITIKMTGSGQIWIVIELSVDLWQIGKKIIYEKLKVHTI